MKQLKNIGVFLSRMFLLDMTSKNIGYVDYVYAIIKMKM
jgi:hypothetical protein